MQLSNRTIFISGASSGIGRAVAIQLAKANNRLVITARRQPLLDELKAEIEQLGSECLAIAADAQDEARAKSVISQATESFSHIDVALLNIGDGPSFNMGDTSAEAIKNNMRINYDTLVNYMVPLISQMKSQGWGHIAHTNSLAGFVGIPQQGPYCAAKAACRLLMDTSRIELADNGIKFTSLYPGFVATERVSGDGIPAPMEISEQRAAQYMIKGIEAEKLDYLFPFSTACLIRFGRLLPKSISSRIAKLMMADEY